MWWQQSFTWHSDPWTMSCSGATIFLAFVALVLPFDSFEGAARTNLRPFLRAGGCHGTWETAGGNRATIAGQATVSRSSRNGPREAMQFQYRWSRSDRGRACEVGQ